MAKTGLICPFRGTCDSECALWVKNPKPIEGGACALRVGPILEILEANLKAIAKK